MVVSESIAGAREGIPKGRSRPTAPDAGRRSHLENSLIFFFYSDRCVRRVDVQDAVGDLHEGHVRARAGAVVVTPRFDASEPAFVGRAVRAWKRERHVARLTPKRL